MRRYVLGPVRPFVMSLPPFVFEADRARPNIDTALRHHRLTPT